MPKEITHCRKIWHSVTGRAFLIGFAILFISFWPWILALIHGLMAIIESVGEYYCRRIEEKD